MDGRFLVALFLSAAPVEAAPSDQTLFPNTRPQALQPPLPAPPSRAPGETEPIVAALLARQRQLENALRDAMDTLTVESLRTSACAHNADLKEMGAPNLPATDCTAKSRDISARYKAATEPLVIESTINAERIDAYRQTGVLPPPKPFDRRALSLDDVDPSAVLTGTPRPIPGRRFSPVQKQSNRLHERPLPAPPPHFVPPKAARTSDSLFQHDAGRGAVHVDPMPALLAQLSDPEPRRRALAAEELAQAGAASKPALPQLLKAAADPSSRVRASAVLALSRIAPEDESALAAVHRALEAPAEEVRYTAGFVLKEMSRAP